jgi:hypothetical protein
VTHRLPLDQAPEGYRMFRDKEDSCIKVVLKPWAEPPTLSSRQSSGEEKPQSEAKPHLH